MLSWLKHLFPGYKSGAGVPENHSIPKHPNRRLSAVVSKILMGQQVNERLPEGRIIDGPVFSLKCGGIEFKGHIGRFLVKLKNPPPSGDETTFQEIPIIPTSIRKDFVETRGNTPKIDNRTWQDLQDGFLSPK